jgi:2-dehydro-3-deoxygluconokinase
MPAARHNVVTFGELMLRLSPLGHERLLQSPVLSATFGGSEANVAVSLAHFGVQSRFVTRLPANAIGDAAIRSLRAEGVATDHVVRGGSRVGIYFAETGASQRPSAVIYDRAGSAISELASGMIDWDAALTAAAWFHVTGITPALSASAAAVTGEALASAKAAGATISLDLNYRQKLWSPADARHVMRPLMRNVDVLIANEEDIQAALGFEVTGADVVGGRFDVAGYRDVARMICDEFDVKTVAITLRESRSASDNGWSGLLWDHHAQVLHQSRRYDIRVVDRIGAGDSFAAGLIYGLLDGRSSLDALQFAAAASTLKHTIPGDFNRVTVGDVDRLATGDESGRVQR